MTRGKLCRTYNGYDINGLGWQKDGRGNLAPVTIILPTIAMESKLEAERGNKILGEVFYRKLLDTIEEAKDSLIDRYEYMCSQKPSSAPFMYDNKLMAGYDGFSVESALKHGTLVIGQVGLAECLQLLIGCDHTEERGMALAKDIEQVFKDKCAEYKKKYHLNFGVYYSPCESTVYTALVKFREKYGVIPNVSDRDYFTNSMHVPVWHNLNPFEKIDIESQLTGYHSAGCITYVELDASASNNIDGLETIVSYAMDKDIPYFAINVPCDTCDVCGFNGEIGEVCPVCGSKEITHLRRICGYLSKDTRYLNYGKQCEINDRVKHFSWRDTSDLLEIKKEGGCF